MSQPAEQANSDGPQRWPSGQAGLEDTEVLCDLPHVRLALSGDRDHIAAELFRIRLHQAHILPAGANAPTCQESTEPAAVPLSDEVNAPGSDRTHQHALAQLRHCGHDGATGIREWRLHYAARHMGVLTSHASPFGRIRARPPVPGCCRSGHNRSGCSLTS